MTGCELTGRTPLHHKDRLRLLAKDPAHPSKGLDLCSLHIDLGNVEIGDNVVERELLHLHRSRCTAERIGGEERIHIPILDEIQNSPCRASPRCGPDDDHIGRLILRNIPCQVLETGRCRFESVDPPRFPHQPRYEDGEESDVCSYVSDNLSWA
jgi:hypothetical protein